MAKIPAMEQLATYTILFSIIVGIGMAFDKSRVPISLQLVIAGMLFSFIPGLPQIPLHPDIVLNIFLPILIYQISAFASWKDFKKNFRPIALHSVGHVIFISVLIAYVIHTLIPQLGWPLAFVLGAVIAPPDDVAIVSIAEKIRMPARVVTILEGEGMFNDATALIIFRFALAAVATHEFSAIHAVSMFFAVVVGEIVYGLLLGYVLGQIRLKIQNPMLHVIASILTPFIAYLPAVHFGGCGVLATAITGFVIGNRYGLLFTPEFRLVSRTIWPALAYGIQSIIFLLIGLEMRSILENISVIPLASLALYSGVVIGIVIIGRFVWVFPATYLPRILFPSIAKKDPYPPWQYPFLVSWAGMRGGVSMAAALAVPVLPAMVEGANPRDLLIFLVFCVIAATLLLQGLTLPWLLKVLGASKLGRREKYDEHFAELTTRLQMAQAVLHWLDKYKTQVKDDKDLLADIKLHHSEFQLLKTKLSEHISAHDQALLEDIHAETRDETFLLAQIVEVERTELLRLWREDKINLVVRNKLLDQLDHFSKHLPG